MMISESNITPEAGDTAEAPQEKAKKAKPRHSTRKKAKAKAKAPTKVSKRVDAVLSSEWHNFYKLVPQMNEEELLAALKQELKNERRVTYVGKLFARWQMLRKKREFKELTGWTWRS